MAKVEPQELEFAERAPVIVEQRAVVHGSTQEVWDAILDYPGWTRWFPKVLTCEATSDPPTGLGSTRVVTLPGKQRVVERFIGWEERSLWAFTATEAPAVFGSLVERVTLVALDEGRTEVTYRMAFGPKRFLVPIFKAVRGQFDGNLVTALRNLDDEVARRRGA
jgi:hypothetical protein